MKVLEQNFGEQVRDIKEKLDKQGYVVYKNWINTTSTLEEAKASFLEISKMVGEPISHDVNNSIIWDIKSRPTSEGGVITYSEHSHEAELHTDSQYSTYPEDYFGLLTLKRASCGGGLSLILTLDDILRELRSNANGEEVESILRNSDFPFIIPRVFKRNQMSEDPEFNFGPILRDNEIRFRVDTLEKSIELYPEFCSTQQVEAYRLLKKIILESASIKRFYLEDGDLIFINNKTVLHGRTQFMDQDRHLLRIRMNKR